jgi:serine protease AprX
MNRHRTRTSDLPQVRHHIIKPDLVAPGNRTASLLASTAQLQNQYPGNAVPLTYYQTTGSGARSNYYYKMSGTSMAAPVVSGAVALMLQRFPSLSPDQVKAVLMKTASKAFPASSVATDPGTGVMYTSYYDIFTIGAGYLDVWAALNTSDLLSATGTALSPSAYYDQGKCSSKTPGLWTYGEGMWCGATTSCGETMWYGATTSCGATMSCGATPQCRVSGPCGAVPPSGQ